MFQQVYVHMSLLNFSDSCHKSKYNSISTPFMQNKIHKHKLHKKKLKQNCNGYCNCLRSHAKSTLTFATCMVVLPDGAKRGFGAAVSFSGLLFWESAITL